MVKEEIVKRLNSKKEELKTRQTNFMIMCNNEINTSCFERNAINELIAIMQIKTEVKELEHLELISRI